MEAELGVDQPCRLPLSDDERAHIERLSKKRVSRRFTIRECFAVVTVACVTLSLSTYLSIPYFAGVLGLATVVLLIVQMAAEENRLIRLGWWTLAVVYVGAVVAAVFGTAL